MAEPTRKNANGSRAKSGTAKSGKAATANRAKSGKSKKQVGPFRKWSVRILQIVTAVVLFALIAGVIGVGVAYNRTKVPDPNSAFQAETSFVYFRDGEQKMGNFSSQNRQSIPYEEMPASIKDAAVAAENRTFWTDGGISITGMTRAAWTIARGGDIQGGSTITQQYIKILYLTSERTMTRKVKELMLAVKLGRDVPKEQILEGYLNTIYFGRGAYGVQAAAKSYFNIDAKDLTVQQSAFLASVLNNPGSYDPSNPENHDRIMERYNYTLSGLAEMGKISPAEAQQASQQLPEFPDIPVNQRYAGPQGHLMRMVELELQAKGIPPEKISGGGLKITTTFDPVAQDAAVKAAQKYTERSARNASKKQDPAQLHAGISSVDNANGEVIALYGGPDYIADARNWATTPRQTASTFKAFALAAGLRDGFSLSDYFQGNTFTPKGDPVPVRNEYSMQYGTVNLIKATAQSINTAFVDLTTQMTDGPEKVAKAAEDAGAPRGPGWDTNTSRIGLGIPEVSSLEMAGAYSTFARGGKQISPHVVREVQDSDGKVIYQADTNGVQAFPDDLSDDVTYALSNVVEEGTGTQVQTLGRPVAGKTGTAGVEDDVISSWFVAYTKQITTSVMYVAGEQGTSDLDPYARPGDSTFFGGTYPAMTWNEYMKVATKGQKVLKFDGPKYVNRGKRRSTTRPKVTATKAPTTKKTTKRPTREPEPTRAPEPTTQEPEPTTQEPEPTTQEPEPTTQEPEPTTQEPEPTTQEPEPTTQRPTQPTKSRGGGRGNSGQGQNEGQSQDLIDDLGNEFTGPTVGGP